jgi:hypothetical protein
MFAPRRVSAFTFAVLLTCSPGETTQQQTPLPPGPAPPPPPPPGQPIVAECATPPSGWIWCDDFEQDRSGQYFEFITRSGALARASGVGVVGSWGMRGRWAAAQVDAGALHLAFGRTPQAYFRAVDAGTADYRDLYWRHYVRREPGWTGGGADKLSRVTIFASSASWAQAMAAHVWSGGPSTKDYLVLDPASGTDVAGALQTTTYNDVGHFRWLGASRSATALFADSTAGRWFCVEAHVRLNDAGQSNGVFELWIDGALDAQKTGLNWVGGFAAYGINALFLENYWNAGAPAARERYFDNLVVATQRIGC